MRRWLWAASIVVVAAVLAVLALASISDTTITAARFATLRKDTTALRAFLQRMPKGGDLHVHLSGATYAEDIIAWAAQDGLCVREPDLTLFNPPCGNQPAAADALRNQGLYDRLVDAFSMRAFLPSPAIPKGARPVLRDLRAVRRRDAAPPRRDDGRAAQARYEADAVQYAELMVTFATPEDRERLVKAIADETDFAAMLEKIKDNRLDDAVDGARKQVADVIAKSQRAALNATPREPSPAARSAFATSPKCSATAPGPMSSCRPRSRPPWSARNRGSSASISSAPRIGGWHGPTTPITCG